MRFSTSPPTSRGSTSSMAAMRPARAPRSGPSRGSSSGFRNEVRTAFSTVTTRCWWAPVSKPPTGLPWSSGAARNGWATCWTRTCRCWTPACWHPFSRASNSISLKPSTALIRRPWSAAAGISLTRKVMWGRRSLPRGPVFRHCTGSSGSWTGSAATSSRRVAASPN